MIGGVMKVIPYQEKYRERCHDICIHTGSPDNLVNQQHHDFSLLMYCDPYLDHGKCYLLEDDKNEIQGYILCCEDGNSFLKYMPSYFKRIHEVAPSFEYRCDISEYQKYIKEYPAHLHIDILETCCGKGSGTLLMTTLLDDLRKKQCQGIMVGVAKDNERACSFYQKMGFNILEESDGGYVMGQKL